MSGSRLDYELDHEVGLGALTSHGGVPALIEHFRISGGAAAVDGSVPYKRRKRGLFGVGDVREPVGVVGVRGRAVRGPGPASRSGTVLGLLLGHGLPAAQTARDFLSCFDEPGLAASGAAAARRFGRRVWACAAWHGRLRRWWRTCRRGRRRGVATIDLDATIVTSSKRVARPCYDGRRGYQPVVGAVGGAGRDRGGRVSATATCLHRAATVG